MEEEEESKPASAEPTDDNNNKTNENSDTTTKEGTAAHNPYCRITFHLIGHWFGGGAIITITIT